MSTPAKGYFSLVQYCPDFARQEAANIGVLLFSPQHGFLEAQLDTSISRIRKFFGSHAEHARTLRLMKEALLDRLKFEKGGFTNLEDLTTFVETRANRIILTKPKAVRVENPAEQLKALYATLVAEPGEEELQPIQADHPLEQRLEHALSSPDLAGKIKTSVQVKVPLLEKELDIPFAFQNGRFNLIQPVHFHQKRLPSVIDAACKFAIEGHSLYQHRHADWGNLQLVVVGDFDKTGQTGAEAVEKVFSEYQVKFFTEETLHNLKNEIRLHGKIIA